MNSKKRSVLIIVDMQNDFITGSLANSEAQKIVPDICTFIKGWKGPVICTRDTHYANYMKSLEGKHLPVEHCIKETAGWCIEDSIQKTLRELKDVPIYYLNKETFGSLDWRQQFDHILKDADIYICGVCTDICVVSNALILKAIYPEDEIYIYPHLCAGVTPEKHKAALETMASCQINIVTAPNCGE